MRNNAVLEIFNKVRGGMDLNTFTDLSIYILLLKKVELIKPDYFQDKYSLGFLSRLYGDLISEDELCDYINSIENHYDISAGILVEPFRNIIRKFYGERDKKTLLEVFRTISEIPFEDERELSEALDMILEYSALYGGMRFSEYITSPSFAKLEAALLEADESSSIYDPFCGSGTSVVMASKSGCEVSVRDINVNSVAIAAINMIVHDCNISEVNCGDSLFSYDRKYDRIVSEPPFNVRYVNSAVDDLIKNNVDFISKDTIDVESIIKNLNESGKAVVLVPAGVLFRGGRTTEFRKYILESNILDSVISIPAGAYCGTGINTAIMVFDKAKSSEGVMMLDSSSFWEKRSVREFVLSDDSIDKISQIIKDRTSIKGISHIVRKELVYDSNTNLTPTAYVDPYTVNCITVKNIDDLIEQQVALEEEFIRVCGELNSLRKGK